MIHLIRKQALQSYGLPLGSYREDAPTAPVCPVCHLEMPITGNCC